MINLVIILLIGRDFNVNMFLITFFRLSTRIFVIKVLKVDDAWNWDTSVLSMVDRVIIREEAIKILLTLGDRHA